MAWKQEISIKSSKSETEKIVHERKRGNSVILKIKTETNRKRRQKLNEYFSSSPAIFPQYKTPFNISYYNN